MIITIARIGSTPWGTLGKLKTESGFECVTIEREWKQNRHRISCIPAGEYPLRLRRSAIVNRTTHGKHRSGWEVCDVPGRKLIMIHPANWQDDLEGCIAPGSKFSILDNRVAVVRSLPAFNLLMDALASEAEHRLRIEWDMPEG